MTCTSFSSTPTVIHKWMLKQCLHISTWPTPPLITPVNERNNTEDWLCCITEVQQHQNSCQYMFVLCTAVTVHSRHMYRYVSKNWNIMKKLNVFGHWFQKLKPIYYIDSLHRVKYFKPLFLAIWWLWLTDNENPKFSVSENQNSTQGH